VIEKRPSVWKLRYDANAQLTDPVRHLIKLKGGLDIRIKLKEEVFKPGVARLELLKM